MKSRSSVSALEVNQSSVMTYKIYFTETGLAIGTNWSVTIYNNTSGKLLFTNSSIAQTMVFKLPNSTYAWKANPVPGYVITLFPSGHLYINGSKMNNPNVIGYGVGIYFSRQSPPSFWNWTTELAFGLTISGVLSSVAYIMVSRRKK